MFLKSVQYSYEQRLWHYVFLDDDEHTYLSKKEWRTVARNIDIDLADLITEKIDAMDNKYTVLEVRRIFLKYHKY